MQLQFLGNIYSVLVIQTMNSIKIKTTLISVQVLEINNQEKDWGIFLHGFYEHFHILN